MEGRALPGHTGPHRRRPLVGGKVGCLGSGAVRCGREGRRKAVDLHSGSHIEVGGYGRNGSAVWLRKVHVGERRWKDGTRDDLAMKERKSTPHRSGERSIMPLRPRIPSASPTANALQAPSRSRPADAASASTAGRAAANRAAAAAKAASGVLPLGRARMARRSLAHCANNTAYTPPERNRQRLDSERRAGEWSRARRGR